MAPIRSAEIIAVGSELLTPFRSDTNSLFLTSRLNELGIDVRAKAIVGDDHHDLSTIFRQAIERADLVILTGGLGPTDDDLTREAVASVLERPLAEDPAILEQLQARFASRGMPMPAINRRQAQVPRGAVALANINGSAPGLWIEAQDKLVVLLPGPPRELEPMFDASVAPRIEARTGGRRWRRRVIKITGRAESQVDEAAQPIYSRWRDAAMPIVTTILATPGQVELHLSASGADLAAVDRALEAGVTELAGALVPYVFSTDGKSLEAAVGAMLHARGAWIAVAESCTGGLVAGRLTEVSGSSGWVRGGVVAYDNAVKIQQLGVPPELIERHGAVSEAVACAMAEGVRTKLNADVGLAITGIAGPSGGSREKPVGTVVIAVAAATTQSRTVKCPGDRRMVRQFSVAAALDLVRRTLQMS